MTIKQLLVIPLLLPVNVIAGCTPTHVTYTYTDPVAYCAAVNTIDRPGDQYIGPASPEWLEDALARELHLGPAVSNAGLLPIVWRCADGKVVACSIGFGMPCEERSDTSRVPTRAILDFCRAFPDDNRPLPTLDGQLSAYGWGCRAGWPHIIGVRRDIDAQGYPRRYWFLVMPSGAFSAEVDGHWFSGPTSSETDRPMRRKNAGKRVVDSDFSSYGLSRTAPGCLEFCAVSVTAP